MCYHEEIRPVDDFQTSRRHLAAQVALFQPIVGDFSEITAVVLWLSPKSTSADLGEIRNILVRSRRFRSGISRHHKNGILFGSRDVFW
jgi:hypothetical protein